MIKFSIIISVYNGEVYIKRAMDSVLEQDYLNFEFIIVDDGSTDKTFDIINIIKDNRVKLLRKKNSGVSDSRNCALNLVSGDWILFLDADDWLEKNTLTRLKELLEKHEIDFIFSNLYESNNTESKKMYNISLDQLMTNDLSKIKKHIISLEYSKIKYGTELGNCRCIGGKLYKSKIIKENNIKFPVGIETFEDGIFNLKYIKHCENAYFLSDPFYHYFYNENSVTHTYKKNQFDQIKKIMKELQDITEKNESDNFILSYTALEFYCRLINCTVRLDGRKEAIRNIKTFYFYLKNYLIKIKGNITLKNRLLLLFSKYNLFKLIYYLYFMKSNKLSVKLK